MNLPFSSVQDFEIQPKKENTNKNVFQNLEENKMLTSISFS